MIKENPIQLRKQEGKGRVIQKEIQGHLRRLGVLSLNTISNNDLFLHLLKEYNVSHNGIIKTIFVAYGDSEETQNAYTYAFQRKKILWDPSLVGFFKQGFHLVPKGLYLGYVLSGVSICVDGFKTGYTTGEPL